MTFIELKAALGVQKDRSICAKIFDNNVLEKIHLLSPMIFLIQDLGAFILDCHTQTYS